MTKHWKSKTRLNLTNPNPFIAFLVSLIPYRKNKKKLFRLKASMEEVQKRFLAEQKTLKDLNDKARQIEEALA